MVMTFAVNDKRKPFLLLCAAYVSIVYTLHKETTVGADDGVNQRTSIIRRTTGSTMLFQDFHANNEDYDTALKILLEDFSNPQHKWVEMNDPVMGGKSTGAFVIENGVGIFEGQVVNVPFLHAPGFIQVRSIVNSNTPYPDISNCEAIELNIQSNFPQYEGYRISFGTQHAPHGKMFAYGYKKHFTVPPKDSMKNSSHFQSIILPITSFTDYWDDATGDAIKECNPNNEDSIYCPSQQALRNIQTIGIWGEGVAGNVSIIVQSIYAINCNQNNVTYEEINPLIDDRQDNSWTSWIYHRLFGQQVQQHSYRIMWNPTIYRYRW